MNRHFLKPLRENFAVRVFAALAILICFISFSFAAFCIRQERMSLRESAVSRGHLLTRILAHSARIGVFSENEKLLAGPIEAILQQEGVLEVGVYNFKGQLLGRQEKLQPVSNLKSVAARPKMTASVSPQVIENENTFLFLSPVLSNPGYSQQDSLVLGEDFPKANQKIIGFVTIAVDKEMLNTRLTALLHKSILMGSLFLLLSFAVTYLIVRGVTKPLNRLTEAVKALGTGTVVQKVPVETADEVGKLASAFNDMSEALRAREDALRESEHRLRSLSSQLMNAQEKERLRLSKELHDELGHSLALLKHSVRSIQTKLPADKPSLREECGEAIEYIGDVIENVRRLSRDLSPSILEDIGLSSALEWLIESVGKQYSLEASFDIDEIDELFSKEAQTNLYRISQEALTNIVRHAQAEKFSFLAKRNNSSVSLVFEDDGQGFDLNEVKNAHPSSRGLGLDTMTERARMLEGFFDIRTQPGKGTRITITIPLRQEGMK